MGYFIDKNLAVKMHDNLNNILQHTHQYKKFYVRNTVQRRKYLEVNLTLELRNLISISF